MILRKPGVYFLKLEWIRTQYLTFPCLKLRNSGQNLQAPQWTSIKKRIRHSFSFVGQILKGKLDFFVPGSEGGDSRYPSFESSFFLFVFGSPLESDGPREPHAILRLKATDTDLLS